MIKHYGGASSQGNTRREITELIIMNQPIIVSGAGHPVFADRMAAALDLTVAQAEVSSFQDGESRVQILANVRGSDVFIVQPTCPPVNHNMMELMVIIDAVRRASAEHITAVMPFYGYARQDRKDKPRVPISAKLVANLLTTAGANRVLTMDLHAAQIQGFFDIPVDHLFALPVVSDKFVGKYDVVCAPDLGGLKRVQAWSKALQIPLAVVFKDRIDDVTTSATGMIGNVKDKRVLIVDDMTETLGTLVNAATLLRNNGATLVDAFVTHALINNDNARERMQDSLGEGLVLNNIHYTNTTPVVVPTTADYASSLHELDVTHHFAEAIRRIHNKESVTQLFAKAHS